LFTGLVERVGKVVGVSPRRGASRIGISSPLPVEQMQDGDSIAVDGVCLTVAERRRDRFYADVVAETLARSTLGKLRSGHKVNLERSLRLGDRLGGHLVLGHVDGTVEVVALDRRGADCRMRVSLPPELARYLSLKGSVAVHGVSLTVAGLEPGSFEIALVPHTLERTTLGQVRPGDRLNVEVDLLARYLERLIHSRDPDEKRECP
jgi:riboflavin synthase